MPRTTRSTSQTSQARAREANDPFAAFNGAAAETLVRTCQAYTSGATSMNAEVMSFLNNRLNRDVKLGEAVCKCENLAGVVNLQQEWARQATQEYFAEAGKLVQLAAKLAQESWEPVYQHANHMLAELEKPLS